MKINEGKFKEWTQKMNGWNQKMKEWTMLSYLLSKNDIAYGILPPLNTIMEELVGALWDQET